MNTRVRRRRVANYKETRPGFIHARVRLRRAANLKEAARWRRDVQRCAPERLDAFDRLLRDSLENPKEAQHDDTQGH